MTGDIVQETNGGWFFRDNGDGTFANLSTSGTTTTLRPHVLLVRDRKATGNGDPLATRIAVGMANRAEYA